MAASVSVISIATQACSATLPAAASGVGSVGGARANSSVPDGASTSGEGRSSFSKALQDTHHQRATAAHASIPRTDATAGSALPPTGNPLPGSPPWPIPGTSRPPAGATTSGSAGLAGDPGIAAIGGVAGMRGVGGVGAVDSMGGSGAPMTDRSATAVGTPSTGSTEVPPGARIDRAGYPMLTANSLASVPRAAHDIASGIANTTSGGAASSLAASSTTVASPPSATGAGAHTAAPPPNPALVGVVDGPVQAEVAAALRASEAAGNGGAEADRVAPVGRSAGIARASTAGGGDPTGTNSAVGGANASTAGGTAPNGGLAKAAAAMHAAAPGVVSAHAPGKTPVADSSMAVADASRVAASAVAPAPTPGTTDHAPLPAHGPIDFGSHELPSALADRVTWLTDQNLNGASLQVNPPHLGPVELRVSVERGHAAIWLSAHNAVAYDALQSGAPRLRELLGAHGFTQVSVDVSRQSYGGDPGASRQSYAPPVHRETMTSAEPIMSAPVRAAQGVLDAYA